MWGTILSSLFGAIIGKLMAWIKQNELEQQAALAQELKQHLESVQAANAAEAEVNAAVAAHQEAAAQVTDLTEQLNYINQWNQKSVELRDRKKGLKVRVRELKK